MIQNQFLKEEKRVLILNAPSLQENDFFVSIFRIPEVLNRLRQYREILSENDLSIPVWVYCITQDAKTLKGSPQFSSLNLIVSLGLFDRYLTKQGWPDCLVGCNPLLSVITGEDTFEEAILALTKGHYNKYGELSVYKINSYVNSKTNTSYLTSLKKLRSASSFEKIMDYIGNRYEDDTTETEQVVQFLGPNEQELKQRIEESLNIYVQDFLEGDEGLRWLWPIWKKMQIRDNRQSHNYGQGY